jgi:uncharacterized membrane protein YdjX (TVP38/TMEM64 family)
VFAAVAASPEARRLILAGVRQVDIRHLRAAIVAWGAWAPVASILLMVLHTIVPFPAELLTAANGAVFGFWGGLIVSWVGAMAAACVGFALSRVIGRSAIVRLVPERTLRRADAVIGNTGWEIALVLRLIPFISFNLVNMALGLTHLPWSTFLWTTGIGILPVEVALVAVGYGAAGSTSALRWGLLAVALVTATGLIVRRRGVASGQQGSTAPPRHG